MEIYMHRPEPGEENYRKTRADYAASKVTPGEWAESEALAEWSQTDEEREFDITVSEAARAKREAARAKREAARAEPSLFQAWYESAEADVPSEGNEDVDDETFEFLVDRIDLLLENTHRLGELEARLEDEQDVNAFLTRRNAEAGKLLEQWQDASARQMSRLTALGSRIVNLEDLVVSSKRSAFLWKSAFVTAAGALSGTYGYLVWFFA